MEAEVKPELLTRIESFEIDGPDKPLLSFEFRLAREQGWTLTFARRAICEYKRFVYLALTAEHIVCPSEQVDAVWHLHLTYTRSYWHRFCSEILGRPLHHDPTKGTHENVKHRDLYLATLNLYRSTFREEAPADFWPAVEVRFGEDLQHQVVNLKQNWVIPKAWIQRVIATIGILLVLGFSAIGCGEGINPFNLVGSDFFYFIIPLMLLAVSAGFLWRSMLMGSEFETNKSMPKLSWWELAYLSGGQFRLITTTITRLIQMGMARITDDQNTIEATGLIVENTTPIEDQILSATPLIKGDIKNLAAGGVLQIARRLEEQGYIFAKSRSWHVRFATSLPLLGVILFLGLPRLIMGVTHHRSSGILVFVIFSGLAISSILFLIPTFRTRKGKQLLNTYQSKYSKLRKQIVELNQDYIVLTVALFGASVLEGTHLATLHQWYPKKIGGEGGCSSGCSCGGSGGGGGCGGGGGGCGGGGGGCGGGGGGCGGGCGGCGGGG